MTSDEPKTDRLVQVVQELSFSRNLNDIMKIVRKAARELTDADGAAFVLKDGEMCYYADEDAISPLWKGMRFPTNTCISGWSMINKQPVVIEDIYEDSRVPIEAYESTFVKSLVMVPIRTSSPVGAIGNYWQEQHRPTREEVHFLQSLADVTAVAMKNVEFYKELENQVKERTAQLEAFSYSVAHDLQNPLFGMELRLRRLKELHAKGMKESEFKEITEDLDDTILKMNQMIQGLLEFYRLGKQGLNLDKVDMETLVKETVEEVKSIHPGRSIEVNVEDLPMEIVDPILFRRVWTNLISNAVEYSKEKDRTMIRIGMEEEEGEHYYYIEDNGKGFSSEKGAELFKPFKRLHADEDKFKGTGVGLSMVNQIILKHGGKVRAEGEPEKGATFYFSLPFRGYDEAGSVHPGEIEDSNGPIRKKDGYA